MQELASLYIEGSLSHATNLHREAEIDSLLTSTVRRTWLTAGTWRLL